MPRGCAGPAITVDWPLSVTVTSSMSGTGSCVLAPEPGRVMRAYLGVTAPAKARTEVQVGSDISTDVIVVGAGVVGASCAYHLARAGLQVTVVESFGGPAQGSTGRSFASVRAQ